ncbi:MAG TPA: hypothetical protein PLF40_02455 [Kofleriaceae bacterium]|nr:hypothetical protein [Kofleriaceae bacterium]
MSILWKVAVAVGLAVTLNGCAEYLAIDPAPCGPRKNDAAFWPDAWLPDAATAKVNAGPLFPDAGPPPCQDATPDAHTATPDAACVCDAPNYPDANPR